MIAVAEKGGDVVLPGLSHPLPDLGRGDACEPASIEGTTGDITLENQFASTRHSC